MLTVGPFNGDLKVHIRQFHVNGNGEMKAVRIGITSLSLEEFDKLITLIPQVQGSIARFELRATGISSSPFAVSQAEPIFLDLDFVFLPSPPSQEPFQSFETMNFWTVNPNLHFNHRPFPIYHIWLNPLWKRFCLILVEKKNSRNIIKTLLLMNICMVQQSMKKHELLNMITQ